MPKYLLLMVVPLLLLASTVHAQAAGATATVTWTEGPSNGTNDETGFGIERKLGPTGTYTEVGQVGANVLTYSESVLYGITYCYHVYAFNAKGKSGYGPEVCGMKLDPKPATPGTPKVIIE